MCSFNQVRGRTSRPSSSRTSSYKRVKGRSHTVEKRKAALVRPVLVCRQVVAPRCALPVLGSSGRRNAGDFLLWIVSEGSVAVAVVVIIDSRFECWCCCACVCARGRILNMRMRYPSISMGVGNRVLDWKSTNSQAAASESCTVSLKRADRSVSTRKLIGTQLCTRVRCTFL